MYKIPFVPLFSGSGGLNKLELGVLCKKLQLEDQSELLLAQLLKDDIHKRVSE